MLHESSTKGQETILAMISLLNLRRRSVRVRSGNITEREEESILQDAKESNV